MDSTLTLERAKTSIRQREAVREQQKVLKSEDKATSDGSLDAFPSKQQGHPRSNRGRRNERRDQVRNTPKTEAKCSHCGREQHLRFQCPTRDAQCHYCNKRGHYSAQCLKRTVSGVQYGDALDSTFLDTVSSDDKKAWISNIKIKGKEIPFKVDTGAEGTAIARETWQILGKPKLHTPNKQLYGPDQQPLEVLGHFLCHLQHKEKAVQHQVFVVDHLKTNLLGLPAITALQLAVRMDSLQTPTITEDVLKKFPKVFQGLGTMAGEYNIQLCPDAKPHALYTPRHVPLPLRPQVEQELERMEKAGVTTIVCEPTPWCVGMVVVPKKSGSIRICVDLKLLNQSVLREVHPLPKVDDTLVQLTGAKNFSKLDANSGFWQIPLSQPSRLLTTFVTPFGRYCFNKLPFGITSAPEHFQRRRSELLAGLKGVQCLMDDILVIGKDQAEHNQRLEAVLRRIEEAGVTLNQQKCEFSKDKLTFLGHVIDAEGVRADPEKSKAIKNMSPPTSVQELRRFLGMANQLGKFTPNLADITQPLRELLSK